MTKIESKFFKGEFAEWEERRKAKNFFNAERKKEANDVIEQHKKAVLLAAVAHFGETKKLLNNHSDSFIMSQSVEDVVQDLLTIHFTRKLKAFVPLTSFFVVEELNLEPLLEIALFELEFFNAGYEKARQEILQSIQKL